MKTSIYTLLSTFILILSACSVYRQDLETVTCSTNPSSSQWFSKSGEIEEVLERLLNTGIPGAAVAIYSDEGLWEYSAGYSKIEDKTLMRPCHLHYLQSISKTYLGATILKLYEEGRIDLEATITDYLPEHMSQHITGADRITVRMLLNHTSGIPEYISDPYYLARLLQNPETDFEPINYLETISGKDLVFEPGTYYWYCNTNYEILALIADEITGDHAKYMEDEIFQPLGLDQTFYRASKGYLEYPEIYNAYWDRYSNGILENISKMQRQNVSDLIGDDGIVSTPRDAVAFLKALMEGKIISQQSLELMKDWVQDTKGNNRYGLGLTYLSVAGNVSFGHNGGGLGAGCQLYYVPDKNLYFFVGINIGTVTESPIHDEAMLVLNELYDTMLN